MKLSKRSNEITRGRQEVERIREAISSKPGKSAKEADTPHRNFIPKQIEFIPSDSQLLGLEAFQRGKTEMRPTPTELTRGP